MSGHGGRLGFFFVLLSGITLSACLQIPPHNETARVARFVAHHCDWGALATISTHEPVRSQPFANVFSVSDGAERAGTGVPYMYLTNMEISVQDLQVNSNASLTMSLAQTHYCRKKGYDPQSPLCAHIILSGSIQKVGDTEIDTAKVALFSRHPEMKDWPHDHDWFFAKFNITNIWVLDYFGGIKTVTPEEYYSAKPWNSKLVYTDIIYYINGYTLNSADPLGVAMEMRISFGLEPCWSLCTSCLRAFYLNCAFLSLFYYRSA